MKKAPPRKKRNEYIYGTTAVDISQLVVTVNQLTGEISFGSAMVNTYSEISYDRPKGPKVLSRVPQSYRSLTFDGHKAFAREFDYHCAVDTNTKTIAGRRISVTAVLATRPLTIPGPKGMQTFWKFDVPFCLEWTELKVEPEKFGWLAAHERLVQEHFVTSDAKIGMIVDSDLGNIHDYNRRAHHVLNGFFLPANVTLVYATADAGRDNILNKALAIADSVASQCLDAVEKGAVALNTRPTAHPCYQGVRIIRPDIEPHGQTSKSSPDQP